MARFWWGCKEDERKIAWVAWDKLSTSKFVGGLGFRRLEEFNEALLAKQCWRVLKNPNLLSSIILRARYFPSTSILGTTVGNRPSYVWRSIWSSRWVLEKGCRWVVGDGSAIKVWSDPWIDRPPTFKVISKKQEGSSVERVADLLNFNEGGWDEERVRQNFLPFEAEEILNIPLASTPLEDIFIWSYEKSGNYSVKSGYNFINFHKSLMNSAGESSINTTLWSKIWQMVVPPKVRMFIWRLCCGALPTAYGLHKRIESISPLCSRCNREEETPLHAIRYCNYVNEIWEDENVEGERGCPKVGSAADWVWWWLCNLREEERAKVAIVAWNVWNVRNEVVHGKEHRPPAEVVAAAVTLYDAFMKVGRENVGVKMGGSIARAEARWSLPCQGFVKINTDGAIFKEIGVGLGVILREDDGRMVRTACQQIQASWDVNVTEAKAVVLGLKMAIQCNIRKAIVECDCLQVVNLINKKKSDGSQLGVIIREIWTLVSWFDVITFRHVYREANLVAHTLAHFSPMHFSTRVWVGGCPCSWDDVIAADLCLLNNNL